MIAVVSNLKVPVTQNSWRRFLYGPTAAQFTVKKEVDESRSEFSNCTGRKLVVCDSTSLLGWFQDPFRTFLTGMMVVTRDDINSPFSSFTYINPWNEHSEINELLPPPKLTLQSFDNNNPTLKIDSIVD